MKKDLSRQSSVCAYNAEYKRSTYLSIAIISLLVPTKIDNIFLDASAPYVASDLGGVGLTRRAGELLHFRGLGFPMPSPADSILVL